MRLIVHIGMPKTGTSTIQRSLIRAKPFLESQGILYPTARKIGHAHTHLAILDKQNLIPGFLTQIYGNKGDVLIEAGQRILEDLEVEIRNSDAQTCILSSEAWFFRPYLLRENSLASFIERNFDDLQILCYTRRPSSYFLSALQQQLKSSPDLIPLRPPNFRAVIDLCEEVAPTTIASFEGAIVDGRDILFDFLSRIGAKPPYKAITLDDDLANRTFSAEAIILLWEYRKNLPLHRQKLVVAEDRHFQAQLRITEEKIGRNGVKPKLKPNCAKFLDRRTPDLEYLRDRFGIDYSSDSETGAITPPAQSTPLVDIIEFNDNILDELRRELTKKDY